MRPNEARIPRVPRGTLAPVDPRRQPQAPPESEDEKRRYEEGKVRHVQRIQRLKGKG